MAGDVTRNFIMRAKTQGVAKARAEIGQLGSEVGHLKSGWATMGTYAMRAGTAVAAVGAASVVAGAAITGRLGAAFVRTGSQVEQYRIQLNTVIRDTEKAGKLFNYLVEFGAKTPFELPGLIEAATQMEAFGVSSQENLTVVGDMAAAMNKDITQAAMAVTQFMQGESEMMKQFAISVSDVEKELGHKMERRTIQGQQEALEALLSLMRKRFSGGMEEMSKSWAGMMSNMSDNWFKLKMTISQGGVFDVIKGDLKETLDFVDRFSSEGGFEAIAVGFGNAFSNIHDVFFQPMFDNMDAMEFSAQSIAVNVENAFTRMALSVGDVVVQLKGTAAWLKTMAVVGANVLPTGQPAAPTSPAFQNVVETYQKWGDTSARLRQRTEDLSLAQRVLAHDTSLSIIEFTRGAEVLAGLGTQMASMRDKATGGGGGGGGAATTGGVAAVPTEFLPDTIAPILDETTEVWRAYFDNQTVMGEDSLYTFEAMAQAKVQLEMDTAHTIEAAWSDAFRNMGRYQEVFTHKGMNLGRAINSFLIRGAGEVGKAVINALVAQARIKATYELAEAAASFATGNLGAAAGHLGAAAKYGLVGGAAGIATALIDREVSQREEALIEGAGPFTETGGSGVSARGRTSGTARSVRTGQQINNFYITLTNNVGGDYITNEGGLTDAQQLQRLFDEGIIQVPQ